MMFAMESIVSSQDILAILNCHRLPGRLTTAETSVLLGFQEHDIAPLAAARLLTPLGKPAPNVPKYFASIEVQNYAENSDCLSQTTKMLSRHWHEKNIQKKSTIEAAGAKITNMLGSSNTL